MKSLKTVQAIARVLRILVKIGLIFTIIGAAGALIGGIALLSTPYLGRELTGMIVSGVEAGDPTMLGIALVGESVYLAGVAVAMGFTCRYFKNELADGTPFTHRGAKELLRAGILNLAVPLGALCLCSAITAIAQIPETLLSNEYEAVSGTVMILLSFVLHYGADLESLRQGSSPANL